MKCPKCGGEMRSRTALETGRGISAFERGEIPIHTWECGHCAVYYSEQVVPVSFVIQTNQKL